MTTKGNPPKGNPPIDLRAVLAGKPELTVRYADLTVTARALAKWLAEKCDYLFVHDRKPVIVELAEDDNTPTMRPVGVNETIIAAHKLCQPIQYKDGKRLEVTLPDKVAELYLAMPDKWRLRPLASFANGPMLRDDGTISCEKGYDAATGVYIYNVPKITVPDKPSREDAKRALATLRHTFRTFAFADRIAIDETFSVGGNKFTVKVVDLRQPPGRDESAFLAALLTAVCRPSLPIAPAIAMRGVSLSGSGVGKKLLLDSISHVAFGQAAPSVALGKGKEFEKGLVAAVIRPDPMLVIDNINGRQLESEALCTVLTDRPAMVRVLGVSKLKEANPRMLVSTAGNGYTFAEDLVRRNFVIELDAKVENPELRKFAGNFLADIAQQRRQLLQAALTIWRYGRQQVKSNSPPLGGFAMWSQWIRDPLVALGCEDPVSVAKITKHKSSDPNRLETVEILRTWWTHHQDKPVKANDLDEAVKASLEPDPKKRSRQNVARLVAKLDGTRLAGFHLTSDKDDKNRGHWTAVSYRLEQVDEEESEPEHEAPAPKLEPEAAAGSSEEDDADGWPFNREPDIAAAADTRPGEAAVQRAPKLGPKPNSRVPPSDLVERWRACFARLDPARDPCAGFRAGEWPRIHSVIRAFLAGPFVKPAADHGWTDRELFGVHPIVGVARTDACGVLMTNGRGAPVTHVTPDQFRFGNLVGRKDRINVSGSVLVWNWKEADLKFPQPLPEHP